MYKEMSKRPTSGQSDPGSRSHKGKPENQEPRYLMDKIQVRKIKPNARILSKGSERAAGRELYANKDSIVPPRERRLIATGISLGLPGGSYGPIAPQSGLAVHNRLSTSSVRYGASAAPKNTGPRRNSPPRPANRPGAGRIFRLSRPLPPARAPPHPCPGQAPVKFWW